MGTHLHPAVCAHFPQQADALAIPARTSPATARLISIDKALGQAAPVGSAMTHLTIRAPPPRQQGRGPGSQSPSGTCQPIDAASATWAGGAANAKTRTSSESADGRAGHAGRRCVARFGLAALHRVACDREWRSGCCHRDRGGSGRHTQSRRSRHSQRRRSRGHTSDRARLAVPLRFFSRARALHPAQALVRHGRPVRPIPTHATALRASE